MYTQACKVNDAWSKWEGWPIDHSTTTSKNSIEARAVPVVTKKLLSTDKTIDLCDEGSGVHETKVVMATGACREFELVSTRMHAGKERRKSLQLLNMRGRNTTRFDGSSRLV